MNTTKPDCSSSLSVVNSCPDHLNPELRHLMKRIEFFSDELKVLQNCDTLDTTVIGTVETVALLSRRKDEPRIQVAMTCKYD